jgi:hypothetical protein
MGITGGVMMGAGLMLAPFTAGFSLFLTAGGAAMEVGAAGTTLAAMLVKDQNIKTDIERVDAAFKRIAQTDKEFSEVLNIIQDNVSLMRKYYQVVDVQGFLQMVTNKNAEELAEIEIKGYAIGAGGYKLYIKNAVQGIRAMALAVQVDIAAMELTATTAATNMAAPGVNIFGKVLIAAGSTSAKLLGAAFALLGIGFGINDMVQGIKDINGSSDADNI